METVSPFWEIKKIIKYTNKVVLIVYSIVLLTTIKKNEFKNGMTLMISVGSSKFIIFSFNEMRKIIIMYVYYTIWK